MANNIFVPVPPQIIGGATNYTVSDRAEIRQNNEPVHILTALQRNATERYKTITIKQKHYYVHRIVYFSFHPAYYHQVHDKEYTAAYEHYCKQVRTHNHIMRLINANDFGQA